MTHRVVANDDGQYSTWPRGRELPPGWTATGFAGSEEECLDHIALVWTDLSPRPRRGPAGAGPNTLDTPRLVLRELTPGQVAGLLDEDAGSGEWLDGYPLTGSGFAARNFQTRTPGELRPGFGMYHLVRRSDGLVIGDLGFHRPPTDGAAEIGFGLAESARGQGYATEAVTALARWAFTQPGLTRIKARTTPANFPSQGVLTRAGFRQELAEQDVLHYALLPPDVLPQSEPMREDEAERDAVRELGEVRKAGGDHLQFVPGTNPLRRVVRDGGRLLASAQSGEKLGVEDDVDHLMYIVVHPDAARRGLATGLLGEIREHALAHGRKGLVTGTHDEDEVSVAWMRKHGFEVIGRHRITRRAPGTPLSAGGTPLSAGGTPRSTGGTPLSAAGTRTADPPAGLETSVVDRTDNAAVEEFTALAARTMGEATMPGGARMTVDPDEIRNELIEDNKGPLLICRASGRPAGWLALTPLIGDGDASALGLQVLDEAADQGVPAALLAEAAAMADQSRTILMVVAEEDGQRELTAVLKDYGFIKVAGRTIWRAEVDPARTADDHP
jgi:RimJ/RimL family protein N-acetyltransferase